MREAKFGDLFQINEHFDRAGWTGAIVTVTEPKEWGIQGFIHSIQDDDNYGRIYIRLEWDVVDYVGRAVLIPEDDYGS